MSTNPRPNILLIHADQHRSDCLGAYGNNQIKTPNIDAIAKDGVMFTNCFCTYPVCTPSRYSTLSGQYVWQHNGWTNNSTLSEKIPTFARVARDTGYDTAAVGKMHFTPTYLDVGFDKMFLCEQCGAGRWDDDYHRYLMDLDLCDVTDIEDQVNEYRNVAPDEYWDCYGTAPSRLPEKDYSTSWIGDRAVEQIDAWDGNSNVLMVGFVKPHHPMDPPAGWFEMYDPDQLDILPGWTESFSDRNKEKSKGFFPHEKLTKEMVRRVTAAYYGSISQIDHHVGRMLDLLKEKGLYDNTMIIYTSDHGDYVGHQHMILKGNHMYDPLVRVPLIIKYAGNEQAGTHYSNQVSGVDVATTIIGQLGHQIPEEMAGIDLARNSNGRPVVFTESACGNEIMARTPERKLILGKEHTPLLLFDLVQDPYELDNVLKDPDYAGDVKALVAMAWEWRRPEDVKPTHLDEQASTIHQPNVPSHDLSHRPAIKQYYREKMREARDGQ